MPKLAATLVVPANAPTLLEFTRSQFTLASLILLVLMVHA
jgi:hypothetical protein